MRNLVFILLTVFVISSCEKAPGTGGKAKINVHIVDGNSNVGGTEIHIKYGATSYPGQSSTFDDVVVGDYTGKASFKELKRGDYYIYSSYTNDLGELREGGAYIKINNKPGEQHIVIDFDQEDPF